MNTPNQKTVRELKNHVLRDLRCEDHFELTMRNDPRPSVFWDKLNDLGWQRKTQQAEQCGDVDATAFVSDEEYEALLAEAHALLPILGKRHQ